MAVRRREGVYNPNRRIQTADALSRAERDALASRIAYGGNLEHKLRPGDYGLGQPPNPRPRKMLCDAEGPFEKSAAESLLRNGARKGMVSAQLRNGWPQNIWSVSENDTPYESQLENKGQGVYHGYPMAADDPLYKVVLKEWKAR